LSFDLHFFALPVPFEPSPLSEEAAAKLNALVKRFGGPVAPNQHGYFFDMPNGGGHIEFYAGKTEGAMLALREFGSSHLEFAWDVMSNMGWALLVPVDEEKQMLLTSAPVDDLGMLAEMEMETLVRVIDGPSDLQNAITEPFETWAAWRDQIVADAPH
jgi:hypothetical protein